MSGPPSAHHPSVVKALLMHYWANEREFQLAWQQQRLERFAQAGRFMVKPTHGVKLVRQASGQYRLERVEWKS